MSCKNRKGHFNVIKSKLLKKYYLYPAVNTWRGYVLTGDHHKLSWVQMRHPVVKFWKNSIANANRYLRFSHRTEPFHEKSFSAARCGKNPSPNSSIYLSRKCYHRCARRAHLKYLFTFVDFGFIYTRCKVAITRPTRRATAKGNIFVCMGEGSRFNLWPENNHMSERAER